MKRKNLLITGASGFLGSHFARRVEGEHKLSLFAKHADTTHKIQGMDLLDFNKVQQNVLRSRPDVIVHLGGVVNLTRDVEVAKACIEANVVGTLNVLESARKIHPKLFIYVSTEEIYGNAAIPYKEISLPQPPSPYAITKLSGEYLSDIYGKSYGFPVRILRLGTMYGPGETEKRYIPGVIIKALRNEDIPINSGTMHRDYVFIEDVVDAIVACVDFARPIGTEVINIGGGKTYTLRYVVEKIVKMCQSTSIIRYNAFPDRVLESAIWKMDIQKAKKLLGWQPKTTLIEGLKQTIDYYKKEQ